MVVGVLVGDMLVGDMLVSVMCHLLAPIRFEATQEKLPKSAAVLLQQHFRRGTGAGEEMGLVTLHFG